eukprot:1124380-Rhodomonas_salina.2
MPTSYPSRIPVVYAHMAHRVYPPSSLCVQPIAYADRYPRSETEYWAGETRVCLYQTVMPVLRPCTTADTFCTGPGPPIPLYNPTVFLHKSAISLPNSALIYASPLSPYPTLRSP